VPLAGNPLAVVHDADGVDEDTMLRFARETRLSETTFVQTATTAAADYRNRIWTIAAELPFAGHPSLGTAVAVARRRGEPEVRYVQETGAGLQPIDVALAGERATASMLQSPAEFGDELDGADVLPGAHPDLPLQLVSTGLPTVIAPMVEGGLARAYPDLAGRIGGVPLNANFYVVDCTDPRRPRARMFTTMVEGGEDPATGSAAGPLCAYLNRYAGVDEIEITQGVEMGRPSILRARMEDDGVRVGGDVVTIVEGTLTL
jgi:trans-2,3-dihydro-3-hydroxyanthranilate isomerase